MKTDRLAFLGTDEELARLSRGAAVVFAFQSQAERVTFAIEDGDVRCVDDTRRDFALEASDETWSRLFDELPKAQWQSILSCVLRGDVILRGCQRAFEQHLHLVRRVHEILRGTAPTETEPSPPLTLTGSYHRIRHSSYGTCDVYVERSGKGVPVVCLPTAGSDTTQFHGLSTELRDDVEMICIDLPWHGKSQPPWGKAGIDYSLSEAEYLETLVLVVEALGLDRPVVLGASMAGATAVRAALKRPGQFRGAIAAQTRVKVSNRVAGWFDDQSVNQNIAAAEWTFGLMSPYSDKSSRDRVWWGYSRGGFRTYATDIRSYIEWDLTADLQKLPAQEVPIVLLGGAFDTTVPPDAVADLAARIPWSDFIQMDDLGHFPHAESPDKFAGYVRMALTRLSNRRSN